MFLPELIKPDIIIFFTFMLDINDLQIAFIRLNILILFI
jgi:hypothetical protein